MLSYLGEAVQSVLDQTYRDFEVIVVDDGSSDNCREVAACFGNQIRYIWQANQGLGGARNTGILAADGDLIGLLDADDQWRSTFLETMVSLADQWSDAAIYYCCAQGMDAGGHDVAQDFGGPARKPEEMQDVLLRANFLIPSTVVMRRSTVVQVGLFEQSNRAIHGCEDWDLWLRIVPEHRFIGTSDCLSSVSVACQYILGQSSAHAGCRTGRY